MAATNITGIDTRIDGVNQDTNFVKQRAHIIDCEEHSGLLTVATHDLVKLPKGEMVSKVRVAVLKAAASSGSATVRFGVDFNGTAESIGSAAIAIADLAAGDVHDIPVSGVKGFDEGYEATIQMTVGTAALTALKVLLIIETIPASDFLHRG